MLSGKKEERWPIIKEKKGSGKRIQKTREFTIKDARNTWEVVINCEDRKQFTIKGYSLFYFEFNNEKLRCFKTNKVRVSDSGELACFDDRYNLINDDGERKTLRLKNLKEYLKEIF